MTLLQNAFLRAWPRCWTCPPIWIAANSDVALSPVELVSRFLERRFRDGRARDVLQVMDELLNQGEIDAAEALLLQPEMVASLSDSVYDELSGRIELRREEISSELEPSLRDVESRAVRLDAADGRFHRQVEDVRSLGRHRLPEAKLRLARIHEQILAPAAGLRILELRQRLIDMPEECEKYPAWASRIEDAIERGDWETATALLEQGAESARETRRFRRAPRFPYAEFQSREICRWLIEPQDGPPGRPQGLHHFEPTDLAAQVLLTAMYDLLTSEQPTLDSVEGFGKALTEFLGRPIATSSKVEERGGYFWLHLPVGTPWLPVLYQCHGAYVPLAVPARREPPDSKCEGFSDRALLFDPWLDVHPRPRGALRVTTELLFRLIPEPATRWEAFILELSRQIALADLLPPIPPRFPATEKLQDADRRAEALLLPPTGIGERPVLFKSAQLGRTIDRYLQLADVGDGAPDDSLLRRIVFYSGSYAAVANLFVRTLFRVLERSPTSGRGYLDQKTVDEAWNDPDFKLQAGDILLRWACSSKVRRVVFAALVYEVLLAESGIRAWVALGDIVNTLTQAGAPMEEYEVEAALRELESVDLVEVLGEPAEVRLEGSGTGLLVVHRLRERIEDELIEAAAEYSVR